MVPSIRVMLLGRGPPASQLGDRKHWSPPGRRSPAGPAARGGSTCERYVLQDTDACAKFL